MVTIIHMLHRLSWRKKQDPVIVILFTIAENEFFRHRLLRLYPRINDRGIETSINFLAEQKKVNCPCFVHTEMRGHEWIVFRRQPDRKISDEALTLQNAPTVNDDVTEEEEFFSYRR